MVEFDLAIRLQFCRRLQFYQNKLNELILTLATITKRYVMLVTLKKPHSTLVKEGI